MSNSPINDQPESQRGLFWILLVGGIGGLIVLSWLTRFPWDWMAGP
jgi:hypothetical protein